MRSNESIYRQTPRDGELTRISQVILELSREYAYSRTTYYIREHSTAVTLIKNILRHYCPAKREKGYMHRAIESASDVISHNTREALKAMRLLFYNKITNYF